MLDTDEVEEDAELSFFDAGSSDCLKKNLEYKIKSIKNLKKDEREFLKKFAGMDIRALRARYLPEYLTTLVDNRKKRIKGSNILLVWKLFSEVNTASYCQNLIPQPSNNGGFIDLAGCQLAHLFTWLLQRKEKTDNGKLFSEWVSEKIPELIDKNGFKEYCTREKVESFFSKKKPIDQLKIRPDSWTPHSHLMWCLLFPKVYKFITDRKPEYFLNTPEDESPCSSFSVKTSEPSVNFAEYGRTNGREIIIDVLKLNSWTARAKDQDYNSRNFRSRVDKGQKACLNFLAGTRNLDFENLIESLQRTTGYKGLIGLDNAILNEEIKTGLIACEDFFEGRVIICIDPGVINMIAGVIVLVDTKNPENSKFLKFKRRLHGYYSSAGINKNSREYKDSVTADVQDATSLLSKFSGRTSSFSEFMNHYNVFPAPSETLVNHSLTKANLKRIQKASRSKQRYWSNFVKDLYGMASALVKKARGEDAAELVKMPVIVFGNGNWGTVKRKKTVGPVWIRKYLSRFFTVLLLDEYNTSQKCSRCWSQLKEVESSNNRLNKCGQCRQSNDDTQPFKVNRDISAPINMLTIAWHLVRFGKRPDEFQKKKPLQESA